MTKVVTFETYAYVMREEDVDLSFATFGDGAKRLYPAPTRGVKRTSRDRQVKRRASSRGYVAPREGLEPPTRRLEGDRSIQLSYRGVACDGSRPAAHDRGTTRCVDTPSPHR